MRINLPLPAGGTMHEYVEASFDRYGPKLQRSPPPNGQVEETSTRG